MRTLVALRRYPLKSARGEDLTTAVVEPTGLQGDRIWAGVDAADTSVGSAKHPRRWGRLLEIGTALTGDDLTLTIGTTQVQAGTSAADAALSNHLGRPVRLTRTAPAGLSLHRVMPDDPGMVPDWMAGAAPGDESTGTVDPAALGRFVDFGPVHLVTTGELAALGERLGGGPVDAERFRPNLVLDQPADPVPGEELRLGDVVLRVLNPTPRCIVPGLEHGTPGVGRAVLGVLARHYRRPVADRGRAACFGTYAEVVHPGRLEVGRPVR